MYPEKPAQAGFSVSSQVRDGRVLGRCRGLTGRSRVSRGQVVRRLRGDGLRPVRARAGRDALGAATARQADARERRMPDFRSVRYCSSRRSSLRNLGAFSAVVATTPIVTQPPITTAGTRPSRRAIEPM